MKMKLSPNRILNAYRAVHELSRQVFPYRTARAAAELRKRLDEEFEIIVDMERAMAHEFGGEISGNGTVSFRDGAAMAAFNEKHRSAMEEAVEVKLPRLDLSGHTDSIRISPDAVAALEGIVLFEGGKSDG